MDASMLQGGEREKRKTNNKGERSKKEQGEERKPNIQWKVHQTSISAALQGREEIATKPSHGSPIPLAGQQLFDMP